MDHQPLHMHQFTKTVIPPTCQENGYTLYSCACGYTRKDHFVPIGGHSFQAVETTPATCTEEGSIRSVCSVCGEETTQTVPALGHEYGEWVDQVSPTCEEAGKRVRQCRRCPATEEAQVAPLGHEYGEWIDQVYPTCVEAGKRVRQCRRCPATEEAQVAPLGHKHTAGTEVYERGKVVEFFCAHCGQTIYTPLQVKPPRYGVIRALFLAAVATQLLSVSLTILSHIFGNIRYSLPFNTYGPIVISMMWSVLYCIFAKQIKSNDRYTRWMGIAPLLSAIISVLTTINLALWEIAQGWADNLWETLSFNLPALLPIVLIHLFFAVIFFTGMRKKTWLVVLQAIFLCVSQLGSLFALVVNLYHLWSDLPLYYDVFWMSFLFRSMHYFSDWILGLAGLLSGIAYVMLIMPVKTKTLPPTPSKPEIS